MKCCNNLCRYISNNPLAHELLDFLDSCGLVHLHPVLVKHDITSVKEFSQLSQSAIEKIALNGHELSTRPLMKETVDICCAISAAQSSKFILPVSKRLKLFEDKEASFLTVIYSSYAIYLALQKPFFSFGVQFIFFVIPLGVAIFEIFQDPVLNLPYIIPNLTRAAWLFFAMMFVFVFNSLKAAFRTWFFWCFMTGTGFAVGFILDKMFNGKFEFGDSKICAASFSPQLRSGDYAWCVNYNYAYFGINAAFYWVLTCCILFRQNIVWRSLTIGITLQLILSTYSDSQTGASTTSGILGCIFVPLVLAITETLRFYGYLQALEITKRDSITNAKHWEHVLADSHSDLEQMAQKLHASFDSSILDRSSDLGKYGSAASGTKRPAPIQQPIRDFDELYNVASVVNNTFQTWVESFFGSDTPSANFLYVDEQDNIEHLHQHLRFESFHGIVSRGPVKLPERAIAKVLQLLYLTPFAFSSQICQVYRTYRGNVSLITDIVRCSVQFETVAEMRTFVSNWIMKYGLANRSSKQVGWLTTMRNETREFFRIFGEYFRRAAPTPDASHVDADEVRYTMITPVSEDFKLFEICRIRNRLDPNLIDAPGGYRDIAFKLKMGFVRCGLDCFSPSAF